MKLFYLACCCVCYETVQITNDELMFIYPLLKMDAEVIAHFAQKRIVLSDFPFSTHTQKKDMERGPEPELLYMCSSSGVKKALNQVSLKRQSQQTVGAVG